MNILYMKFLEKYINYFKNVKLYDNITKSIDRLSGFTRKERTINTINFVIKKLLDLKSLLKDAVTKDCDFKSYI